MKCCFSCSVKVAEIDGAAFAEIAVEESVEFVEQFLAESGFWFCPAVDFLHQGRAYRLKIGLLHPHQVDETGVAFHPGASEHQPQCIEEAFFFDFGVNVQSPYVD